MLILDIIAYCRDEIKPCGAQCTFFKEKTLYNARFLWYNGCVFTQTKDCLMNFTRGLKDGLPIALGYMPVAFAYAIRAIVGG